MSGCVIRIVIFLIKVTLQHSSAAPRPIPSERDVPAHDISKAVRITAEALELLESSPMPSPDLIARSDVLFEKALEVDPWNGNALTHLGLHGMMQHGSESPITELAHSRLVRAFSSSARPSLNALSPQGYFIASIVARRSVEVEYFERARRFLDIVASSPASLDHCSAIQAATLVTGYPISEAHAKEVIQTYHERLDILLEIARQSNARQPMLDVSKVVDNDPFVYCVLTAFFLEIYHEADLRSSLRKHYEVTVAAFPSYTWTAPHLRSQSLPVTRTKPLWVKSHGKRMKLGILSAFFYEGNSVLADFGGVMERLPRDRFEITFIFLKERPLPPSESGPAGLGNFIEKARRESGGDVKGYAFSRAEQHEDQWLKDVRNRVASLKLDLLLFLDGTMSKMTRRVAMSRLAQVQAVSHGHPVTTGIPRSRMDYYISWAAAELPLEESKDHYTEELVLLPEETMHQYLEPRMQITESSNGETVKTSRIDGMRFDHIDRSYFLNEVRKGEMLDGGSDDHDGILPGFEEEGTKEDAVKSGESWHWYTCMQKPFKRHPAFDEMLAGVLKRDHRGVLLLHGTPGNSEAAGILRSRLEEQGVDMRRVHFLPPQSHHALMALYSLSDVILDSFFAGGCTTTREALEIGAPVVTLPAKYLGGRWSYAYYSIMGMEKAGEWLVARNKDEYVDIAVRVGKNVDGFRDKVVSAIEARVKKLFGRHEAVDVWVDMLERLAEEGGQKMRKRPVEASSRSEL